MWSYILKRLLLMIPTLLGILLITFIIIQFVPGGPVEQMVAQLQGRDAGGVGEGPARAEGAYRGRQGVDAARVEEIKKLSGFDKPAPERVLQMLGGLRVMSLHMAQPAKRGQAQRRVELIPPARLIKQRERGLQMILGRLEFAQREIRLAERQAHGGFDIGMIAKR